MCLIEYPLTILTAHARRIFIFWMKFHLTFLIVILNFFYMQAQDIHSSQFYSVPSGVNPAFTGFFSNDYFVAATYKTQYGSISTPYQTIGATAEVSLLKNKRPNSILGVGTQIIHDRAGSTTFTTDIFNVNVSYLQVLDVNRKHVIGAGFQNGISLRKFDISKATFDNQFNGYDGFDQNINPNESGLNTRQIDYNLAIGGLYSFSPKEHYNLFVSFSAFNLLQPNVSFYNEKENKLFRRYTAFAGGEFKLKDSWSMLPSVMYQKQGPHHEAVFGSFVRYGLIKSRKERLAINVGAWYRLNDAIIPAVKLEYKGFNLTMNFDVNVSKLSKVSRFNGGGEITISYSGFMFKEHVKPAKPLFCPAFVY